MKLTSGRSISGSSLKQVGKWRPLRPSRVAKSKLVGQLAFRPIVHLELFGPQTAVSLPKGDNEQVVVVVKERLESDHTPRPRMSPRRR